MLRRIRSSSILVALFAVALIPGAAQSAPATPEGPAYPPPGGVDWNGSGDIARAGGLEWAYANLDMTQFHTLWWGAWAGDQVQLAFDGAIDAPGEHLAFDAGNSDLENGIARWSGSAVLPLAPSGSLTIPTRFTIMAAHADATPLALTLAEDACVSNDLGALVPVTGEYHVNLLFEGFDGTWRPAADLYDVRNTIPDAEGLKRSFSAGFYYVTNIAPEASFTTDPASPREGREVTLTSTSTDPDGTITATEWDVNDDGSIESTDATLAWTFDEGDHLVTLRVTDDLGAIGVVTRTITVRPCDDGPVSSVTHEAEFFAGAIGREEDAHELNCSVLGDNGL